MRGIFSFILHLNWFSLALPDPNSYAQPELVRTSHLHLDLAVDFDTQQLVGEVVLTVVKASPGVESLILDTRDLGIGNVTDLQSGEVLDWKVESGNRFGDKLEVILPKASDLENIDIVISYSTRSNSSALQWLSKELTSGKRHPFLFSQNYPIHARSMVPCQDTPSVKASYSATISAPAELTAVMSAVREGTETKSGNRKVTKFQQKVPVPSYLIALAVGQIESRQIGPRSHVWAEEALLDLAATDFSQTETFLQIAEDLSGEYVWGVYDILVLPPSFPYGAMENPCTTFVSPTLLSGDKSNADIIAHEIAHSWTGNLVTNINFQHFWLSEGFTMFVERKILGRLHGEEYRDFSAILRWKLLTEIVEKDFGCDHPFTSLVTNLTGVHPDEAYSFVPYEKGSTFLRYLEETVGGAEIFEQFLRDYYKTFAYTSIASDTFRTYFTEYFNETIDMSRIDWNTWLYSPGMPIFKPDFDDSLARVSWDLAEKWQQWDLGSEKYFPGEFFKLSTKQKEEFLWTLFNGPALAIPKMVRMANLYKLDSSPNMQILFIWIRLGIKARWEPSVKLALEFVTKFGTLKFVRPLYRDLYDWEDKREEALNTFLENREHMMHVTAQMVASDLHLEE